MMIYKVVLRKVVSIALGVLCLSLYLLFIYAISKYDMLRDFILFMVAILGGITVLCLVLWVCVGCYEWLYDEDNEAR